MHIPATFCPFGVTKITDNVDFLGGYYYYFFWFFFFIIIFFLKITFFYINVCFSSSKYKFVYKFNFSLKFTI